MANELPNAAALMKDSDFRDWIRAAGVYQARLVILEAGTVTDHASRLALANIVVVNPDQYLSQMVNIIACDPAVASVGTTVGTTAGTVTQPTILQKMSDLWTPLAKLLGF